MLLLFYRCTPFQGFTALLYINVFYLPFRHIFGDELMNIILFSHFKTSEVLHSIRINAIAIPLFTSVSWCFANWNDGFCECLPTARLSVKACLIEIYYDWLYEL